jgi:hypothetical protein
MRLTIKSILFTGLLLLAISNNLSSAIASDSIKFSLFNYNRVYFDPINFSFSLITIADTNSYQSLNNKLSKVRDRLSDYRPSQAAGLRKSFLTDLNYLQRKIISNYKINYQANIEASNTQGQQLQAALNKDYLLATNQAYNNYKQNLKKLNKRAAVGIKKHSGSSLGNRVKRYNINKNKLLRKWRLALSINNLYNQYAQFYNNNYQKIIIKVNANLSQSKNKASLVAINNYRLLDNKINQINLLLQRINSSFNKLTINQSLPVISPSKPNYLNKIYIKSPVKQPSSKPPVLGINPLIVYQKGKMICSIGRKYFQEKRTLKALKEQNIRNIQNIKQITDQQNQSQQKIITANEKINDLKKKLNSASITDYDKYTQQIAAIQKQIRSLINNQASDKRKKARLTLRIQSNEKAIANNQAGLYRKKQEKLLKGVRGKIKRAAYKRCPKQII